MSDPITRITIEGFKSIWELKQFELRALNVLIGANGAGKSNFIEFLTLLRELVEKRLQVTIGVAGGANACLYLGQKHTSRIKANICLSTAGYEFNLVPTGDDRLLFAEEMVLRDWRRDSKKSLGTGHVEARIRDYANRGLRYCTSIYEALSGLVKYHLHDTSPSAGVRRLGVINDNETLRPDASNLAAFLYRIRQAHSSHYAKICDVVRLAAPFFNDFKLRPDPLNEGMIRLEWLQRDSDTPFLANQLSDGTLRFMCLATALLQPSPPATMLFDEPELG